jgi:hypothetical protein
VFSFSKENYYQQVLDNSQKDASSDGNLHYIFDKRICSAKALHQFSSIIVTEAMNSLVDIGFAGPEVRTQCHGR